MHQHEDEWCRQCYVSLKRRAAFKEALGIAWKWANGEISRDAVLVAYSQTGGGEPLVALRLIDVMIGEMNAT